MLQFQKQVIGMSASYFDDKCTFDGERFACAIFHAERQVRQGLPGVCRDCVLKAARWVGLAAEQKQLVARLAHEAGPENTTYLFVKIREVGMIDFATPL